MKIGNLNFFLFQEFKLDLDFGEDYFLCKPQAVNKFLVGIYSEYYTNMLMIPMSLPLSIYRVFCHRKAYKKSLHSISHHGICNCAIYVSLTIENMSVQNIFYCQYFIIQIILSFFTLPMNPLSVPEFFLLKTYNWHVISNCY